jgi:hypothetical protein
MIAYDDFMPANVLFHTGLHSHNAAEILDIIFKDIYNVNTDYKVGQDINGEVVVIHTPSLSRAMTNWSECKQYDSARAKEVICYVIDNVVKSKLQDDDVNMRSTATLMSSYTRQLDTAFVISASDIKALREFFVNGATPPPHLAGAPFNVVEVEAIDMISQKICSIIDLRKNFAKTFHDVVVEIRRKHAAYDAFNTHEKLGLDRQCSLELNMSKNDLRDMLDLVKMRDEIILKHEDLIR